MLYDRLRHPLLNPLLWSILSIIGLICLKSFSYPTYESGTKAISFFLGPATVVLAVPMYRQRGQLIEAWKPILSGIAVGVISSALSLTLLGIAFGVDRKMLMSLMPKSVTTPIGISIAQMIGGIPALSVVSIVLTGIIGAMIAPSLLSIFRIDHPVAKGIGIGASTHVIGTSKAIEMGQIEGAMSSLSIALAGVATYVFLPVYLHFIAHLLP